MKVIRTFSHMFLYCLEDNGDSNSMYDIVASQGWSKSKYVD